MEDNLNDDVIDISGALRDLVYGESHARKIFKVTDLTEMQERKWDKYVERMKNG